MCPKNKTLDFAHEQNFLGSHKWDTVVHSEQRPPQYGYSQYNSKFHMKCLLNKYLVFIKKNKAPIIQPRAKEMQGNVPFPCPVGSWHKT